MKALFADISEQTRRQRKDAGDRRRNERRQVLALCDAVQIAVAQGQQDRVNLLLGQMHTIVDAALTRRDRFAPRARA